MVAYELLMPRHVSGDGAVDETGGDALGGLPAHVRVVGRRPRLPVDANEREPAVPFERADELTLQGADEHRFEIALGLADVDAERPGVRLALRCDLLQLPPVVADEKGDLGCEILARQLEQHTFHAEPFEGVSADLRRDGLVGEPRSAEAVGGGGDPAECLLSLSAQRLAGLHGESRVACQPRGRRGHEA